MTIPARPRRHRYAVRYVAEEGQACREAHKKGKVLRSYAEEAGAVLRNAKRLRSPSSRVSGQREGETVRYSVFNSGNVPGVGQPTGEAQSAYACVGV